MANLTWTDRLRIEWRVWSLDQRLYDLPRATRVARRRELRENLVAAAQSVGARTAVANLGPPARLAAELLAAEYGDDPRPHWVTALVVFLTTQLVLTSFLAEAATAFGQGLVAGQPDRSGTFTWTGVAWLQDQVTYTVADGQVSWVGGAWTPLAWVLFVALTVVAGRAWRALPPWRGRSASALAERAA